MVIKIKSAVLSCSNWHFNILSDANFARKGKLDFSFKVSMTQCWLLCQAKLSTGSWWRMVKKPWGSSTQLKQQQPNIFELNVAVKFQRSCYIISPTSGWEMKNRLLIIIYIFNSTAKLTFEFFGFQTYFCLLSFVKLWQMEMTWFLHFSPSSSLCS